MSDLSNDQMNNREECVDNRVGADVPQEQDINDSIDRQAQLETGLYKAVCENNKTLLLEMIDNGADIDTVFEDYSGVSTKSLLHICCEKGRFECAKILLDLGACVNIRDSWGQSPLMCCLILQQYEISELLLSTSPDTVDHQDRYGKTPLHCAIDSGSLESVKLLLKYNVDVCRHNSDGITPVMLAVTLTDEEYKESRLKMIKLMIDAGYDLEMKDFRSKRTALQMSVVAKNLPALELLLASGADFNTLDSGWRTPLTNAIYLFARKPLGQTKCVVDPIGFSMIELLTGKGCDLNMTLVEYCNPLIASALVDSATLVDYFLNKGSNIDIQFDPSGATALIMAVTKQSGDAFKALLRWNCNLCPIGHIQKRRKDYFFDAFQLALFLGHRDMARALAEVGSDLQRVACLKNPQCEDIPDCLQVDSDLYLTLRHMAHNPRTLSRTCVLRVRQILRWSVETKAFLLPVPNKIQELLKMTEFF